MVAARHAVPRSKPPQRLVLPRSADDLLWPQDSWYRPFRRRSPRPLLFANIPNNLLREAALCEVLGELIDQLAEP